MKFKNKIAITFKIRTTKTSDGIQKWFLSTIFMNTPELATCTMVILLGFLSTLFMNTPELATCTMVIVLAFYLHYL